MTLHLTNALMIDPDSPTEAVVSPFTEDGRIAWMNAALTNINWRIA